jgi:hypothetical protein
MNGGWSALMLRMVHQLTFETRQNLGGSVCSGSLYCRRFVSYGGRSARAIMVDYDMH